MVSSGSRRASESSLEVRCDLAAVKSPVFDENLVRAVAGDNDTGKVYTGNVRFKRFQVYAGFAVRRFSDLNADASKKIEIGMISG